MQLKRKKTAIKQSVLNGGMVTMSTRIFSAHNILKITSYTALTICFFDLNGEYNLSELSKEIYELIKPYVIRNIADRTKKIIEGHL